MEFGLLEIVVKPRVNRRHVIYHWKGLEARNVMESFRKANTGKLKRGFHLRSIFHEKKLYE